MHILHFEKGLKYSDRELLVFARKIGKLASYCRHVKNEGSLIRVDAERRDTKKERDAILMTVQVSLPKKVLRAESRKDTALEALDRCIEKLEPQIDRYKEMHVGGPAGARRRRRDRSIVSAA
ncbi:HPF/RaiA family ribosome-associated protein [Candidatus Peregrinibacteria bacterium]|nr:HPF/RaiA family ribosome-associated protein [Candidatus Peregrinibacteria bacterium]